MRSLASQPSTAIPYEPLQTIPPTPSPLFRAADLAQSVSFFPFSKECVEVSDGCSTCGLRVAEVGGMEAYNCTRAERESQSGASSPCSFSTCLPYCSAFSARARRNPQDCYEWSDGCNSCEYRSQERNFTSMGTGEAFSDTIYTSNPIICTKRQCVWEGIPECIQKGKTCKVFSDTEIEIVEDGGAGNYGEEERGWQGSSGGGYGYKFENLKNMVLMSLLF